LATLQIEPNLFFSLEDHILLMMVSMMMKHSKFNNITPKFRVGLPLALGSVLLVIVTLEFGVRLFWGTVAQVGNEKLQLNSNRGWALAPGQYLIKSNAGDDILYQINEQGLRNPPIQTQKPANTFRVIILGDSISEGLEVSSDRTFVRQLELILQEKYPDHSIEVINAGTSDYSTEQEWLWLREEGVNYGPDLVILQWYLNDWRSFSSPPAVVASLHNVLIGRSAAYSSYFLLSRRGMAQWQVEDVAFRFRFRQGFLAHDWVNDSEALTTLIEDASEDWGGAWDKTKLRLSQSFILKMQNLADAHNFDFMLALFPVSVQVETELETRQDLNFPQQQMLDFANQNSIPVIDLLTTLRKNKKQELFLDQAHYTPTGHKLIAETLAFLLEEMGLIPEKF
jgi:lysophospholipase L1-like esterase